MKKLLDQLSAREMLVFTRIAQGKSLAEIADDTGIEQSTVSTYRARVLKKLKLNSNAEIAIAAHRAGLIRSHA